MRRHSAMDFVAGVMVFPGGGVDDRDRNADVAWFGPDPAWWAERLGVEPDLAEALVCAAARETFEESGVLFAGPADDPGRHRRRRVDLPRIPRGAGARIAVVRRVPAPREPGVARGSASAVGELGDAEGGAHPPLRHLLLRRGVAGGPARRRRQHRNRQGRLDHARGGARRVRRGTLVPAAADVDAARLAQRPHASPRCSPSNARSSRSSPIWPRQDTGNWEIEFFNSDRYNEARNRRAPTATPTPLHERVRLRPRQRRAARHRHAAAVATAHQCDDASGVPRDRRRRGRSRPPRRRHRGDRLRRPRDLLRRRRRARAAHAERRRSRRGHPGVPARPSTRWPRSPSPPSPPSPATRWAAG